METLWRKLIKYRVAVLSGTVAFLIVLGGIFIKLNRNYAVEVLKAQFSVLENSLLSAGYDFAYDNVEFYTLSPWQIMRIKNFRIYSLDAGHFNEWSVAELNINAGILRPNKVVVYLGENQSVTWRQRVWPLTVPDFKIFVDIKRDQLRRIAFKLQNISVENLLTIEQFDFTARSAGFPFMALRADIRGMLFDDILGWPLNKTIDHFYVNAFINGEIDRSAVMGEAVYDWIDRGGSIAVQKMILNWKPLIMVGNGDLTFDENLNASLHLNTASLALSETLDKLNENGYLLNKGVFVAKLLLDKKAVMQDAKDKYKTVVTPVKIDKDGVRVENIRIR